MEMFTQNPMETILIAALAVSEALALIPGLKSNGIVHGLIRLLKAFRK